MFRMRYFPNATTCFNRLRAETVWFSLLRCKIPKTYCVSIFRSQRGKEGFTTKISPRSVELWRLMLHIYIRPSECKTAQGLLHYFREVKFQEYE